MFGAGFAVILRSCLSVVLVCTGIDDLADAQLQKVRITISSRSNTSVPYYVAVSKGFFREEGLDVEVIQANPRLGVMALINGDVYFTGTFVSTVRGILSGFPLKIILVSVKRGVYYLIAHPSVKDIHDLKGKKLGVSSIRGSDHMVAEELFDRRASIRRNSSRWRWATLRCACNRCSPARWK